MDLNYNMYLRNILYFLGLKIFEGVLIMAHKKSFKLISLVLALILLALPLTSSMALAETEALIPVIHVPGVNTKDIFKNPGTEDATLVFPPSSDTITEVVSALPVPIAKLAITRDWDAFGDDILPLINTLFKTMACNPDGSIDDDIGIDWSWPTVTKKDVRQTFTFYYDWRGDIMENAVELSKYIDYILDGLDADKVIINAHSMGGALTMSYIAQFGDSKIAKLALDTTAIRGAVVTGESFSKEVETSSLAVVRYVDQILSDDEQGAFISAALDVLYKAGAVDYVADFVNLFIEKLGDRFYSSALIDIFASMPGLWALIPNENYEACLATMTNENTSPVLLDRIHNYHDNVSTQSTRLLLEAKSHGIEIMVLARYDLQITPVVKSLNIQNDMVLDTKYTSLGATCADLRETLSDEYLATANMKYVSPDKSIDASTCLFPDYTWFLKGLPHSNSSNAKDELINLFYNSEEQLTVNDIERFPQFMQTDGSNYDVLIPLTGPDEKPAEESWVQLILRLIKALFSWITVLLQK